MKTAIECAYKAAYDLLYDLHLLQVQVKNSGDEHQVASAALDIQQVALWELREAFDPIFDLLTYCYAEVAKHASPLADPWAFGTLQSSAIEYSESCLQDGPVADLPPHLLRDIKLRLQLEKSVLLKEWPKYLATLETETPQQADAAEPKRRRRKPAVAPEKTQEQVAFEFLLLWHRYGHRKAEFNSEPIPGKTAWHQWMLGQNDGKPVPGATTVSRMLKDKFGSKANYEHACRNGTIEHLLAAANGELSKVFQGSVVAKERSTTDPELDLD